MLSWLFVSALLALCGILGFLQYRWIGEVTVAARERLRGGLQASLNRFSREFNSEIASAASALVPANDAPDARSAESALEAHFAEWQRTARHPHLFSRIAVAEPEEGGAVLRVLDLENGKLRKADWPEAWIAWKARMESRSGAPGQRRGPAEPISSPDAYAWTIPLFGNADPEFRTPGGRPGPRSPRGPEERFGPPAHPPDVGPPGGRLGPRRLGGRPPEYGGLPDGGGGRERPGPPDRGPFPRREVAWVVLELNLPEIRAGVLPELLQRDLPDYQVEVVNNSLKAAILFQSDPGDPKPISGTADGSVSLFAPPAGPGRWQMFVRHREGSLETVVSRIRRRDLAVTAGVLLLILATVAALVRFTRRAQKLAQLQMDFVAGISHELRTPLTVIHTAGYNLRGKMAQNPAQVERYGALIQQESGRLTALVEQIMRFAGAEAGRVIQEPEPLSIESVIHDSMESSRAVMEQAHCVVEQEIEDGLPPILGDPTALRHALQNLLLNAVKYGTKGNNWIGIFAAKATERGRGVVEIRVADRGPGIPKDEQKHIFDPFFRGQRAVEDQVHGTGLGLNLVKKIVEAHGGTIRVKSEPMKGAEFIVRIPEAANGVAG